METANSISDYHDLDRYRTKRTRRRHRAILRGVGATLAAMALVTAVVVVRAATVVAEVQEKVGRDVDREAIGHVLTPPKSDEEPFYVLLLGVDRDQGREQDAESYGADESAYRSDTMLLCRIDKTNAKVTMVSMHRDTKVNVPGLGITKMNAAYSAGGAPLACEVASKFAGVPIAHYAQVDMDGMAEIVDSLGGVDVDLPVAVSDPEYTGIDLPAGPQHLDGVTAALLCRCRHGYDAYGDGDRYRAANQRMVLSSLGKAMLAQDPMRLASTVSLAADFVQTDMTVTDVIGIALAMRGMDPATDVMSGMEPSQGVYENETWYEECDLRAWREMMTRVDQGLPPYEEGQADSTDGVAGSA